MARDMAEAGCMADLAPERFTPIGALWAVGAVFCFSVNDAVIKFLSGDYPLHEIALIRSTIGLCFVLGLIVPFSGGYSVLKTKRFGLHAIRGLCVVMANLFFFLGLASLPLAESVAIFFVSPLIITVASVVFLGETVGIRRWAAIAVGLIGVLVVMRPGTEAFQAAALFPLAAAAAYSGLNILTRRIGGTEGAAALIFYIQLTFLTVCALIGLAIGDGKFAGPSHPSLDFLLRAWIWPAPQDMIILFFLGIIATIGGYSIGQAYRVSEAAFVAPFEYAAMPLAIFWGLVLFGEVPDPIAFLGIALILLSGLFILWRESVAGRAPD